MPYMSLFQRHTEYLLAMSAAWTAAPSTGVFPATACRGMPRMMWIDRKSTRLNSSHLGISYAVFCLENKQENTLRCRDGCRPVNGAIRRSDRWGSFLLRPDHHPGFCFFFNLRPPHRILFLSPAPDLPV